MCTLRNCKHGLAGSPPVIPPISKQPEFQALKAAIEGKSPAEALEILGVDKGFYSATGKYDVKRSSRKVLTSLIIEDLADTLSLSDKDWQLLNCMLTAALAGVVDESVGYGLLVPDGAILQDPLFCGPGMHIEEAIDLLADADPAAAEIVAQGIAAAGEEHVAAYGTLLWDRFKKRFGDIANPFTNPLTGPAVTLLAGAAALLVIYKLATK